MTEQKAVEVEEEVKAVEVKKVAKKPVAKKLTLAEIKKESKKLDEQKEATINMRGTDYVVKYDLIFRKTKQRAVLEDTLYFFQTIGEQNVEHIEMASAYTSLLIIKHFTDLDVPDDISEALLMLEELVDTEVVGQIIAELPEEEVMKIYDLLTKTVENVKENLEASEKEAELLAHEIENKELLEMEDGDKAYAEALETIAKEEVVEEEVEVDEEQ